MVKYSREYYFQKALPLNISSIEAAAVFGSFARGNSDQFSDKDLLLVGKDSKSLKLNASYLKNFGWSCSTYTWHQLSKAVKRSSLFIQHLKLEAIVIKDTDDRLRHFLSLAEPRCCYSWEVEQALNLIGLVEYIPLKPWGPIWALDVLMVGFRSIGYAILANEGMFRFSFDEVLDGLRKIGMLRNCDVYRLRGLRKWKHVYRENLNTLSSNQNEALRLIGLVDRRMKAGIHVTFVKPNVFIENQTNQVCNSEHWYRNSRALEAVARLYPERFNDSLVRCLCSPQEYSCALRTLNARLIISEAIATM